MNKAFAKSELKEFWREEQWERRVNNVPRVSWENYLKRWKYEPKLSGWIPAD